MKLNLRRRNVQQIVSAGMETSRLRTSGAMQLDIETNEWLALILCLHNLHNLERAGLIANNQGACNLIHLLFLYVRPLTISPVSVLISSSCASTSSQCLSSSPAAAYSAVPVFAYSLTLTLPSPPFLAYDANFTLMVFNQGTPAGAS